MGLVKKIRVELVKLVAQAQLKLHWLHLTYDGIYIDSSQVCIFCVIECQRLQAIALQNNAKSEKSRNILCPSGSKYIFDLFPSLEVHLDA